MKQPILCPHTKKVAQASEKSFSCQLDSSQSSTAAQLSAPELEHNHQYSVHTRAVVVQRAPVQPIGRDLSHHVADVLVPRSTEALGYGYIELLTRY